MKRLATGCLWVIIYFVTGSALLSLYLEARNPIFEVAFWVIVCVLAIVGYWLIFLGGEVTKEDDKVKFSERLFRYFLYYAGAFVFFLISAIILFKGLVLGLGVGLEYWTEIPGSYDTISHPRLASWLVSGVFFILASMALVFRNRQAVIYMAVGTLLFLLGAAYDWFLLKPGTYEPPVEGDFMIGMGLVAWVVVAIVLWRRGAFR